MSDAHDAAAVLADHADCSNELDWQHAASLLEIINTALNERDELAAEVREWLCTTCRIVYPGPPQPGLSCAICPKCGGSTGPRVSMELREARQKIVKLEERISMDVRAKS